MWEEKQKIYDELVARCPRFERKGKTMPYTSANGHMFSLLNKAGEIGIRFSREVQKKYLEEFNTTLFKSYNAIMHGYILIPDLWKLLLLFQGSFRSNMRMVVSGWKAVRLLLWSPMNGYVTVHPLKKGLSILLFACLPSR